MGDVLVSAAFGVIIVAVFGFGLLCGFAIAFLWFRRNWEEIVETIKREVRKSHEALESDGR